MAGASIKITVRDAPLQLAFRRLADPNLKRAALKNIGIALVKSTRARFSAERDPAGQAWAKLDPEYAKGKRSTKILQEQGMRGGLLGSITFAADDSQVTLGTNKIYGAIHQFGGIIRPRSASMLVFRLGSRLVMARKVTIPARPYLGLSEGDRKTMVEIIEDHLRGAWNG